MGGKEFYVRGILPGRSKGVLSLYVTREISILLVSIAELTSSAVRGQLRLYKGMGRCLPDYGATLLYSRRTCPSLTSEIGRTGRFKGVDSFFCSSMATSCLTTTLSTLWGKNAVCKCV